MKIKLHDIARRSAAIALLALALTTTACGTTQSTALAPAGAGGQANATTSGLAGGDAYLSADGQYGSGSRTNGATSQANDTHVCAPASDKCLEP